MKTITIIRAAGNELANQLWNYASIYSYALHRGFKVKNPSFFEYGEYFTIPAPNWLMRIFFFLPLRNYTKRKTAFRRRLLRKFYVWYTNFKMKTCSEKIISYSSKTYTPYYLPPTKEPSGELLNFENNNANIYFDGWLFRNRVGLEKYREEIVKYFKPRKDIENRVAEKIKQFRNKYNHIIGLHIRQGDYKTWNNGLYFIDQKRTREIINEYLSWSKKDIKDTLFLITSDGKIEEKNFSGLNTIVSNDNAVADLFFLSSTDTIIGSDSTFGAFASYYGNIPMIVMQKIKIDWSYYENKKTYFENIYSKMVHY